MTVSPLSSTEATDSSSSGKCPVDHQAGASSLWKVLGIRGTPTNATSSTTNPSSQGASSLPASLEEAAKHAQSPHPSQRLPLSTYRVESSIPRGESQETPHHQLGVADQRWVYPSEQQVFNAMKRKGWESVEEEAIPSFLQIHNSVNERSWRLLQEWETPTISTTTTTATTTTTQPSPIKLVRFEGRPQDLTPKAWIKSKLLFQSPPFDRHDWYIDNGVETEKRYVLDFYMNQDSHSGLPRVDIDVRPALDSPAAVMARFQRLAMDMFPGITKEYQRMIIRKQQQQ